MKNNTIIITDAKGKEVLRDTVPSVNGDKGNLRLQVAEFMRERVYAWIPGVILPNDAVEYVGEMRSEDGRQLATVASRLRK